MGPGAELFTERARAVSPTFDHHAYRAEIEEICRDRNPVFGGINPEPIGQNLGPLKDAVLASRADVGLAIDGDADRVGAMDADGSFVDSHRIFALLLRHLYEDKGQHGSVVKTVSTTTLIASRISANGC